MAIITKAELQIQLQQAHSLIEDLRSQLTQARQVELHEVKRFHQEEIARINTEWQTKFDSEKSMKEYHSKQSSEYRNAIDEMHEVLDNIPAAPLKETSDAYKTRSIASRLVGLIAVIAGLNIPQEKKNV